MPLIAKKKMGSLVHVLLWNITEKQDELLEQTIMHASDALKYSSLHNPKKQKEFLALRHCLKAFFNEAPEVFYHDNGKPFLKNGFQISMSHSYPYAAVILSPVLEVGIDIEVHRESFKRVAPKFMSEVELKGLTEKYEVPQLIHFWGAKEVMVKITGNRKHHFKSHLKVAPFRFRKKQKTEGLIYENDQRKKVQLYFETFDDLHISYGWLC